MKKEEVEYTNCDDCGTDVLKGDIRHCESGDEVCEYCYDSHVEVNDGGDY